METLRAPFVLRTFPPQSGGNPVAPGIPLRSLRSASPFAERKGTGGGCPYGCFRIIAASVGIACDWCFEFQSIFQRR